MRTKTICRRLLSVLLLVCVTGAFASAGEAAPPAPVPDTGQDRCYDDQGEIAFPAPGEGYFGQDAQVQTRTPRYRDNGDGTVTDLVTGLLWQQAPAPEKLDQDDAEAYAARLRLAGHDDWRLPTITELFGIADLRGAMHARTPYIDTSVFAFVYPDASAGSDGRPGERNMDAQYASSTRYLGITMGRDRSAFGFNFADGRIKSYPLQAERYVRCVRGPSVSNERRFVDNGDGAITDRATGLMSQTLD
ncbi:MAG: DUF1566 domain-containing protein, partial [Planctomycetota bacterium]